MSSANATSSSMVSKQRTRAAKTKEWEHYKDEILRLYMIENFTLDQVSVRMLEEHGFNRKKHQYENTFKKWGVRKNLRRKDWEFMGYTIQQRQRQQKESDILLYGALLPESRRNRALQRYGHDISLARKFGVASSPEPPEDYPIRIASPPITESRVIVWPKSLPWLQFESNFRIATPLSPELLGILTQAIVSSGASLTPVDVQRIDLTHAIHHVLREPSSGAVALTRLLPYVPNSSQESATTSELENQNDLAFQLLRNFLFQLSNKMVNLFEEDEEDERRQHDISLLRLLHELHPVALDRLLTSPGFTSKAIRESCYRAAVLLSDYALVSKLLEAGTDPNVLMDTPILVKNRLNRGKAIYYHQIHTFPATGMQVAAFNCDLSLAILLMDAGAKADLGDPTPLQILCCSRQHPKTLEFAGLLVGKGARLNTGHGDSPLLGAAVVGNRSLIDLLLSMGPVSVTIDSTPAKLLQYRFFRARDYFLPIFEGPTQGSRVTPLQVAIVGNNGSIISTLISAALKQSDTNEILELGFITACLAGDRDTVQKLLNINPQIIHNQKLINSAFLAISWILDCRIAYLLIEAGARPRMLSTPCVSALQAAALYGNSSLIRLLKRCGSNINFATRLDFRDRQNKRMASTPSSPLECAIYMGYSETAEILLELGANVVSKHLMLAVRFGSHALLIKMLARYQNVDKPYRGQRVLDVAIRGGRGLALVGTLIGAGATLLGHELVHAVHGKNKEVIQFLISLGVGIFGTCPSGETVLEAACRTGNHDMAWLYLTSGGAYDSRALLLFVSRAIETHDYSKSNYVVANRSPGPMDKYEATALMLSIRMADRTLVDLFLERTFIPSTTLPIYCWHGETAILHVPRRLHRQLQDKHEVNDVGVDIKGAFAGPSPHRFDCDSHDSPCPKRCSPMLVAALTSQLPIIELLITHKYQPDIFLLELLYDQAAIPTEIRKALRLAFPVSRIADPYCHQRLLLAALRHSADLETISQHLSKLTSHKFPGVDSSYRHENPLLVAVRTGNVEYVKAILEAGADVNCVIDESTSFSHATNLGHLKIASLLLENGADINANGSEALVSASRKGDLKVAMFLLKHGAYIDASAGVKQHFTALESAADYGKIDMVELLLSHGADIRGRNRIRFVRAVNLATMKCHHAIADLLKKHGGWTAGDRDLAKEERAYEYRHLCPRVIYNDWSWQGDCKFCDESSDSAEESSSSEDDYSAASSPASLMAVDEPSTASALEFRFDDMSMLEDESNVLQEEGDDLSLVPYNAGDRELDDIVMRLLEEDGIL
ncbi:putative Clr5 domain-containing protein [Seiridium unicorne]|uniref:Clr5 domain-containing protein n=1 Tax=Seiridium unicorne TaxID=138068 RepID=A0ABR2V0Q2_9PEZI